MRKPINYIPKEAVEGKWKEELIIYLAKMFNIKTLVETGTCEGSTMLAVHKEFEQCYSIELSDYYYHTACHKLSSAKNITLYHGDSSTMLKTVLQIIPPQKTLFFLDAHGSNEKTAHTDPLAEEIKSIMQSCQSGFILIDDEPNGELDRVIEAGVSFDGWTKEYHYGIIFLFKTGLYKIPTFE